MGRDFFDAHEMAQEALSLHLYGMEKDGETFPEASKILELDSETSQGYLVVPITCYFDIFKAQMKKLS